MMPVEYGEEGTEMHPREQEELQTRHAIMRDTVAAQAEQLAQAQARIRELEGQVHDRAQCALCGETFTTSPYAEAVERAETAEARIQELEQRVRESIDHAGRAQAAEARVRKLEEELVQVRAEFAAVAADYVDYKCSEGGPSSVDTNDLPDDEPTRALVLGLLSEGTWADLMPGLRDVLEARRAAGKGP